jgi:hypothetical protein
MNQNQIANVIILDCVMFVESVLVVILVNVSMISKNLV